ncbi:hypothetical protein AGDE_08832 [Angomonas deanei]|nr:hypothetical protein AGDE_08832 [Angomonas deanei]|eukprot:EPY32164.1 hypothetical protein AGDE_08832 [Angomonas deanei]
MPPYNEYFCWKGTPKVSRDTIAALTLESNQTVLGPLSSLLPPSNVTKSGKETRQSLKVIPEEYADDPEKYLQQLRQSETKVEGARLSLEDTTGVLFLYDAVDCENGTLLRQLLDDIDRFIFVNLSEGFKSTHLKEKENGVVKLPLPQLLYTLSNLGIIEEKLLRHCTAEEGHRKGLLTSQLGLYAERELVLLLFALHRFGMENELAFSSVLRKLDKKCYVKQTSTGSFMEQCHSLEKQCYKQLSHAPAESRVVPLQALTKWETLDAVQLPIVLLLEVLSSLTATPFRKPSSVKHVSYFLAGSVAGEYRSILDTITKDAETHRLADVVKQRLNILSQQLFRAVRMCEAMECPQVLLFELFNNIRESSGADVFADGGEDAEIASDRVAYYDHVTADLVKISHAS